MRYHTYLYCTKAKPFLGKEIHGKYALYKRDYGSLNGTVCFECECKEAFDISKVVEYNKFLSLKIRNVYDSEKVTLYRGLKTGLTLKQIEEYQGKSKSLYAYHFENVRSINPFPITQLYKDEDCTIPLTKAPQSYCFAYRKINLKWFILDEMTIRKCEAKRSWWSSERVLVFSVQSPWLCLIGNKKKDLEVRLNCPSGLEVK